MKNTTNCGFKVLLLAFMLMTVNLLAKAAPPKTDFSGAWQLNIAKSDFGKLPQTGAPTLINISQRADAIELDRSFPGTADLPAVVDKALLTFDGQQLKAVLAPRNDQKTSYLKWSDDGQAITVFQNYKVTEAGKTPWEYNRTEKYALSDDGKTLTIERVTVFPDRTETIKAVYDKQ